MLVTLAVLRVLCGFPGVRELYRALLIRLVRNTLLFDDDYYRENNPDIAESRVNALFHYVAYGDEEGRSPSVFFDPQFYRKSAGGWTKNINALLHFTLVGRHRRLSPSPWFDVGYYLANNKDVARAGIDPLLHYLDWGGVEGRSPCMHFDGAYYLRKYQDVLESRINPLLHYLLYGRLEGRRTLPVCYDAGELPGDEYIPVPAYPREEEWLTLEPRTQDRHAKVDVIIPVYKGKAETLRCIYSVLSSMCETRYELVVINDASPDAELVGELQRLANKSLFTFLENGKNRGFVYTVNRGMRLHGNRDVVLLNSDTEVYGGWLDRLEKTACSTTTIGTLTPLSNNATICSYPYFQRENPFPLELEYQDLDALVADVNANVTVEAPTGVGFCMYIKRVCLNEVGLFDEKTFGRGYGEENDFCQRAIAKGWSNVIAADVFVRHWGSVSFQGEKASLASAALRRVEKKHPNYLLDVAEFIKREPLAEIYQRIDWARLLRLKREKNVLLICHGRGGGTERRVQEDIEKFAADGYGIYLIRPVPGAPGEIVVGHPEARWLPNSIPVNWSDLEALKRIVEQLGITTVYSHSFVDFIEKAPVFIQKLVEKSGLEWVVNVHDYEVICPRLNLADESGTYCGEPEVDACNRCLKMCGSDFEVSDIKQWREEHETALMAASRVIVPDQDVKERIARYYPLDNIEVRPHENITREDIQVKTNVLEFGDKLRVVVIGAISKIKGFDVLLKCARDAGVRGLPVEFILMGYSLDDRLLEGAGVEVTGKYPEAEALERLHGQNPHVVLLPSTGPETYSYTLSIALQAGYPIVAFDIGAIARRLRENDLGYGILPLEMAKDVNAINDFMMNYRDSVMRRRNFVAPEQGEVEVAAAVAFE